MPPQPRDPTPDSATEHAAIYIVALVFTDSGHLRTTLVVTPLVGGAGQATGCCCQIWQSPAIADGASYGPGKLAIAGTRTGPRRGLASPARPESRGAGTVGIYATAGAFSRDSQSGLHRSQDGLHIRHSEAEHLIRALAA